MFMRERALAPLESPLIVSDLSDTLRESPNVEETRNEIPAAAWKKYLNFASKNLPPYGYSGTFCSQFFLQYCLSLQKALTAYSNSFKIWFTSAGFAFPFIAFIVCPTRKPIAFSFPLW